VSESQQNFRQLPWDHYFKFEVTYSTQIMSYFKVRFIHYCTESAWEGKIIFFTADHTLLRFGPVTKTALITHLSFGCGQAILAQREDFLFSPLCPAASWRGWARSWENTAGAAEPN